MVDTNQFGGQWLGFSQVSMTPAVLNRKRDGIFNLYHHAVSFDKRRNFPSKLSVEFLILYMLETRIEDDYGTPLEEVVQRIKTSSSCSQAWKNK